MTRYIIERRIPCSRCNLTGVVTHHLWEQLLDHEAKMQKRLSIEECETYFRDHLGWNEPLPDEEIKCPGCDGEGELVDFVNDTVFITERGLVTREEVDAMISQAINNILPGVDAVTYGQCLRFRQRDMAARNQ